MKIAGFPSPALEYGGLHLSLDEHLIPRPSSTFFVRVAENIVPFCKKGDLLIVDKSLRPQRGNLAVVPAEEHFTVIPWQDGISFEVWGVVTYVIHKVR